MPFACHRIRLDPTKAQEEYFRKACGVARFAYNWGLAEWDRAYRAGEKPNWQTVIKKLRSIQDAEFPWMREVTKLAAEYGIQNLGDGFLRWFKKIKIGGRLVRRPRFKKKGRGNDSFLAAVTEVARGGDGSVAVNGRSVQIAKLGWVRMKQEVRFKGRISKATVVREADHWYVILLVDAKNIKKVPAKTKRAAVGVDLGVAHLATIYDGRGTEKVEGPKPLRKALAKIRRLNQSLHRRVEGSQNWERARMRLARAHARVRRIRRDATDKLTVRLVKGFRVVGVEDLAVTNLMGNRHLSRALSDQGFGEFRRQLAYKCGWYGSELVAVDRFFPSSKLCSKCGHRIESLSLREREWNCPQCGTTHDRDENAAKNIRKYAVGPTVSACGG